MQSKGKNIGLKISYQIKIKGLVQGIGFRPFVYKLAVENNLNGWVSNNNEGVLVKVEGDFIDFKNFISKLHLSAPPAAQIRSFDIMETKTEGFDNFSIIGSSADSEGITEISPDISVCDKCMGDLVMQEHRLDYSFVNCTNCGPRFSIIRALPYDREKTTMDKFELCPKCNSEYTDVDDRRFHAQPVACNNCGPQYMLLKNGKRISGFRKILEQTAQLINSGELVAIKGVGGYFLACNAFDAEAVDCVRKVKNREGKPFALMFKNLKCAQKYLHISAEEENLLDSWRKPIVLLRQKKVFPRNINCGLNTIGCILPYMPFHYQLFDKINIDILVFTSCNLAGEPIIHADNEAFKKLKGKLKAVLSYNREIYNPLDDSVAFVYNDRVQLIRRSRGFVPSPIDISFDIDGFVALGAEQKNCFAIGKGKQAILSQYIGDVKNAETLEFMERSLDRFRQIYRLQKLKAIVCDAHPDYLTTTFAEELASKYSIPKISIYHHHAHIASVMAEYNLTEPIVGVCLDGAGYGEDGAIWGGEVFYCEKNDFKREYNFNNVPLPGGELAVKEPWRMAISYLLNTYKSYDDIPKIDLLKSIQKEKLNILLECIKKSINSPLTSSAGRLFDAVSAMLNVCAVSTFDAEAPMKLEALINYNEKTFYNYNIGRNNLDFSATIRGICEDILLGVEEGTVSAKFHNTIVEALAKAIEIVSKRYHVNKVALSGGVFQNKYLIANLESKLIKMNMEVFVNQLVPSNDGGIALGQLFIASQKY